MGKNSLQRESEMRQAAVLLFWEKMEKCCLTVLRILQRWKITATDRNLLKRRKKDIVRWSGIQILYRSRHFIMRSV